MGPHHAPGQRIAHAVLPHFFEQLRGLERHRNERCCCLDGTMTRGFQRVRRRLDTHHADGRATHDERKPNCLTTFRQLLAAEDSVSEGRTLNDLLRSSRVTGERITRAGLTKHHPHMVGSGKPGQVLIDRRSDRLMVKRTGQRMTKRDQPLKILNPELRFGTSRLCCGLAGLFFESFAQLMNG